MKMSGQPICLSVRATGGWVGGDGSSVTPTGTGVHNPPSVAIPTEPSQLLEVHDASETSRFVHCLDDRLTDGGEVVSLTPRPPFTPGILLYSFLLEGEPTSGSADQLLYLVTRSGT
jgi:hypothetical protein